jgi:hypothetical protein
MPIAEALGTPGYRHDKSFTLLVEHPELLLIPRSKFSVSGSLIQRSEPAEFEVARWMFRHETEDSAEIDLDIREVKLSPWAREFYGLTDGTQYAIAGLALLLPFALIVSGAYVIYNYPNPLWFWVWFGQHVRFIVGWSLLFLLLTGGIWVQVRFRKFAFTRNVLLFLWSLSIWLVPLIWLQVSLAHRPLSGKPEESIQYLDYLRTRLVAVTLLLTGIIPWLTLALKWLGLDLLASSWELLTKKRIKTD